MNDSAYLADDVLALAAALRRDFVLAEEFYAVACMFGRAEAARLFLCDAPYRSMWCPAGATAPAVLLLV